MDLVLWCRSVGHKEIRWTMGYDDVVLGPRKLRRH